MNVDGGIDGPGGPGHKVINTHKYVGSYGLISM